VKKVKIEKIEDLFLTKVSIYTKFHQNMHFYRL